MEKVNTTNTTTDIFVGDKNVGNFTLTTFNNGTMNANFMINDASTFHSSAEAAQDLVNLVNDSISQSKALTTIKVNQKVGVMELKQLVEQHETKLKQHDKELSRLNDMSVEMQKQMSEGLARVDESNRFLREQNTRQSEQNAQILQAVIKGNESSDEHQFQLKLLDKTNFWKLIFGIGGASAAIYTILMEVIKLIK